MGSRGSISGGVVSVSEIPSGTKTTPFSMSMLSRKVDLGKDIGTLQVKFYGNYSSGHWNFMILVCTFFRTFTDFLKSYTW